MKIKSIVSLVCTLALYSTLQATVYEANVVDIPAGGYTIGDLTESDNSWNNITEKDLRMKVNFSAYFTIYVSVETQEGARLLKYTPRDANAGVQADGTTIELGLGAVAQSGNWVDVTRKLEDDLHLYEPQNNILRVHGLKIVGDGSVDDIELTAKARHVDKVYEDAEDGDTAGWYVYDSNPAGATITNVLDAEKNSRVIELSGGGTDNGYIMGNFPGKNGEWTELDRRTLTWDMKFPEGYAFFVSVNTNDGQRFLYYDTNHQDRGLIANEYGTYIHCGLGGYADGKWHTVTVDLEGDLKKYEPNNHIVKVTGFLVRGNGRLDNIRLSDGLPKLPATLYEDFESGNMDKWVFDHDGGRDGYPLKMEIANGFNGSRYAGRFYASYTGSQNTYKLLMEPNNQQFVLELDIAVSQRDDIYKNIISHGMLGLRIETLKGPRLIYWDAYRNQRHRDFNNGTFPSISYYGDFAIIANGNPAEPTAAEAELNKVEYVHFKVDIDEYLQRWEPDNRVTKVDYFLDGQPYLIDNITLSSQ